MIMIFRALLLFTKFVDSYYISQPKHPAGGHADPNKKLQGRSHSHLVDDVHARRGWASSTNIVTKAIIKYFLVFEFAPIYFQNELQGT